MALWAFRPHLSDADLIRAQERLIGAVLRGPSLAAAVRVAGLVPQRIQPELRAAFVFATKSDRDHVRRVVQNDGNDGARLYRLGVELGFGQPEVPGDSH
jgi:hypothetical protein